ncbi:MAG: hypothetical protein QOF61_1561, partial [Acidobacteriota bacterium]|nr:hypothetical protein [Acidobacteriota bacterium]
MDELEFNDYLCQLNKEALDLLVRLDIYQLDDRITIDDLYNLEKKYRVCSHAIRRFRRRIEAQQIHEIEMVKTDEDKVREAEHERIAQHLISKGMDKLEAYAAASGVIAMRRLETE